MPPKFQELIQMKKYLLILLYLLSAVFNAQADCRLDTLMMYKYDSATNVKKIIGREINTYNTGDKVLENLQQKWNNSAWENVKRFTYVYDLSNNELEKHYHTWSTTSNSWVGSYRFYYLYDSNKVRNQSVYQTFSTTTNIWINSIKHIYTYDANKNLSIDLVQTWDGNNNKWDDFDKITSTYDSKNNKTVEITQRWNTASNKWLNTDRVSNTFEANNNLTSTLKQTWKSSTSSWLNTQKASYTYDSKNNKTETLDQNWASGTGTWANYSKFTYKYNANNKKNEELREYWNFTSFTWVNSSRQIWEFAGNGDLISRESWDLWNTAGNYYKNHYIDEFICKKTVVNSSKKVVNSTLTIFPNPTNSNQLFVTTLQANHYSVFDFRGNLIQSGNLFAGENKVNLPDNISDGIYVLRFGNQSQIITVMK